MKRSHLGTVLIVGSLTLANPVCAQDTATGVSASSDVPDPGVQRRIPDTLMFSIDELNEIRGRIAAGSGDGDSSRSDAIESASLYLSTILYYGPKQWTIWVNGVPITPQQEFSEFKVTDIGPDYVELLIPLSAQGMRPVRLSANQTFIAKSGTIVEGKWQ